MFFFFDENSKTKFIARIKIKNFLFMSVRTTVFAQTDVINRSYKKNVRTIGQRTIDDSTIGSRAKLLLNPTHASHSQKFTGDNE